MKSLALIAALAAALVCVPAAPADTCLPARGYAPPGYQAQGYATPAVGVVVPLYGAVYTGGGGDETNELLKQLLQEVQRMRQDLAAIKPGDPVGTLGLKGPDPVAIVRAHCAACHTAGAAEAKGGGFELFTDKGEPLKLSRPDREVVSKRVGNGTMPPAKAGRLAAADKEALLAAIADGPRREPAAPPARK